jgi:hypothetical protein
VRRQSSTSSSDEINTLRGYAAGAHGKDGLVDADDDNDNDNDVIVDRNTVGVMVGGRASCTRRKPISAVGRKRTRLETQPSLSGAMDRTSLAFPFWPRDESRTTERGAARGNAGNLTHNPAHTCIN